MGTASAPASSANLGPGYDVLALALDLRCRVSVEESSEWSVISNAEPAGPESLEMVRAVLGDGPFTVSIESEIPQQAGLGSSAALLVAAAAAVGDPGDRDAIAAAATAVEGHPDNVAAAVHGGLIAVAPTGTRRLPIHPSLRAVVAVPGERLATAAARAALPDEVDRSVAVRTAARIAMLVEGLRTAERGALAASLGDEMHEAPRALLSSTPSLLIAAALESGALYAAWSGAGPSVLALTTDDTTDTVVASLEDAVGPEGRVLEPAIDRDGVRVE
jgi:homoserine kinase